MTSQQDVRSYENDQTRIVREKRTLDHPSTYVLDLGSLCIFNLRDGKVSRVCILVSHGYRESQEIPVPLEPMTNNFPFEFYLS